MEVNNGMNTMISEFHRTWDAFPGLARLIDKGNKVLAINKFAQSTGHQEGEICAKIGLPESHRGCLKAFALKTQIAQMDRPVVDKVRAWVPVEGYPNLVVHFSITIPEINKE